MGGKSTLTQLSSRKDCAVAESEKFLQGETTGVHGRLGGLDPYEG